MANKDHLTYNTEINQIDVTIDNDHLTLNEDNQQFCLTHNEMEMLVKHWGTYNKARDIMDIE